MSYAYQLKGITQNGHLLHSLTCCNGHVYALGSDSCICKFVIRVEIVVKDREVVIKLSALGAGPSLHDNRCPKYIYFLTGTCNELFYIIVGFRTRTDKTPGDVYLFKLDMTSINWKDLECLKNWDISGVEESYDIVGEYHSLKKKVIDYLDDLKISRDLWEEVQDLSETIFVVDIAHDISEFYNPAIALELGGYIHIHDSMKKVVQSYYLNDKTIARSPMPSSVLPTSHMSIWECWLEDEGKEANFIADSKQEEDELVVALIADNVVEASESRQLDIPLDVLEGIVKLCVGVEYINLCATCTRCHLAAPLIQWRNQTALDYYSFVSPWLMVVDQIRGIITFTNPMMGARYFMRCPQLSIFDETICCSRFGWLLFKNRDSCVTFFNPFTNNIHVLPRQYYYIYKLWFSAPPTSSECIVVGFSTKKTVILNVALERNWRVFDLDIDPIIQPICFPTFHGGDLYTLFMKGQLRVFKNFGEADIPWKRIKAEVPRIYSGSLEKHFLMNLSPTSFTSRHGRRWRTHRGIQAD